MRRVTLYSYEYLWLKEHLVWEGTKGQRKQVVESTLKKKKCYSETGAKTKYKEQERCNISIL